MLYEPKQLDRYLERDLKRLSEKDAMKAIIILQQHLINLNNADYYLTIPVDELPLTTKAKNLLLNNQLLTVGEVIARTNLRIFRGLGRSTLLEITTLLEKIIQKKDSIRGLNGLDLWNALG